MESIKVQRRDEKLLRYYISKLGDGFSWKLILSIGGAIITSIDGFYGTLLWGFLSLFALDLVTGILKSKYKNIPITSKKLRDSVVKLGAYMVLLTSLIITSKYESSFIPVISITYYYFMFTELKSIVENGEEMGVKLPSFLRRKIESKKDDYDNND